jgi:hypothetical protein
VKERRGRRRKPLLDDFKETTVYWKFKEKALDLTLWRIRFARDYGRVIREIMKAMSLHLYLWALYTITRGINLTKSSSA